MFKHEIFKSITDCGVVAVVRAESEKQALDIARACSRGGIRAIEITFTVPGADRIIAALASEYRGSGFVIGAGTVLDSETARIAILSGAQFVVSPAFSEDTVRLCNRYAIPVMPGVMTVREAVSALEMGCEILKLFPGDAFGPSIIKSFRGPLPQANFMPTGGCELSNCEQWIKAGAVAVGVGGSLTAPAKTGDYRAVEANAAAFVEAVRKARSI